MSRNIFDVFQRLKDTIPADQDHFLSGLTELERDTLYTPPEIMYIRWNDLSELVNEHIHRPPVKDWEYDVISILTEVSVMSLKERFGH